MGCYYSDQQKALRVGAEKLMEKSLEDCLEDATASGCGSGIGIGEQGRQAEAAQS